MVTVAFKGFDWCLERLMAFSNFALGKIMAGECLGNGQV
jgi:hypothetical protein